MTLTKLLTSEIVIKFFLAKMCVLTQLFLAHHN